MRKILFATLLCVLALGFTGSAFAAEVGDSWVYCARVDGDVAATPVLNSWFTFQGAIGNSSGKATVDGVPPGTNGLYFSANVPVVGVRTCTFTINLPVDGTYEVFEVFAATTSAKPDVKHVITTATGTSVAYTDQTIAGGNVNKWVSLGTYDFLASQAAVVQYTNDNQTTSGSLYIHSLKFVLTSVPDVPEPGSMLALGTGLVGLLGFIRRKRA